MGLFERISSFLNVQQCESREKVSKTGRERQIWSCKKAKVDWLKCFCCDNCTKMLFLCFISLLFLTMYIIISLFYLHTARVFEFSYFTLPTQSLPKVVHSFFAVNFFKLDKEQSTKDHTLNKRNIYIFNKRNDYLTHLNLLHSFFILLLPTFQSLIYWENIKIYIFMTILSLQNKNISWYHYSFINSSCT